MLECNGLLVTCLTRKQADHRDALASLGNIGKYWAGLHILREHIRASDCIDRSWIHAIHCDNWIIKMDVL